ncbi:MAG: hypothetical protein LIR50_13835 [Bacillota bacterium]|nr:hypothetical protein [Bacillota bacterium]
MSKKGLTEIVCVIDKSSSMKAIEKDAIGGFNKFVKAQKEEAGQAAMTVVLFDTDFKYLYFGTDIQNVKRLTKKSYVPSGTTALLDAVGKAIDDVGARLSDTPEEERPERVIFAILNGGEDNSGKEYTRQQVFDKIRLQTYGYKWQFVFLAANQDAARNAELIGIDAGFADTFESSGTGIRECFDQVNEAISSYRQTGIIKEGWKK